MPMDLDAVEGDLAKGPASFGEKDEEQCSPCGEGELDTLKGSGKGQFQEYCKYCGKCGHRKSECHSLTKAMGKGDGKGGRSFGRGGDNRPGGNGSRLDIGQITLRDF